MPNTTAERLQKCFLPLLLLTAAGVAWRPLLAFDDFWQHAAVGRWILRHGEFPQETLFLWSAHQKWIAHSWGTQVVFALIMRAGEEWGPRLALVFSSGVVCAVYTLLWRLWTRRGRVSLLAPFLFILAITGCFGRYDVRPELFTALFLTILLAFLIGRNERPQATWSWRETGIVAMFALWANLHGAFVMGIGVLGLAALGDCLQDRCDRRARLLWTLLAACCAVSLINPYGLQLFSALRQVNSFTFSAIDEWKPFWAPPPLEMQSVASVGVLTLTAFMVWLAAPRRRLAHGLWLLALTVMFLQARRQLWLLAIVDLAVMGACAEVLDASRLGREFLMRRSAKAEEIAAQAARWRLPARWFAVGAIVLTFVAGPLPDLLAGGKFPSDLPKKLCAYLDAYNPPGNLLNGMSNAAYLAWRFGESRPLYIDHLQAHSDDLTRDYVDMTNATLRGQKLLDELTIGTVLLRNPRDMVAWPRLAGYLNNHKGWELVFYDFNAALWVRKTPATAAMRANKHLEKVPQ